MTWLVTGGCGFIGLNLVEELLSRKESVIVIDNLSNVKLDDFYSLEGEDITFFDSLYGISRYNFHVSRRVNSYSPYGYDSDSAWFCQCQGAVHCQDSLRSNRPDWSPGGFKI